MFLSIIHNRSGEQVVLRRLGPNENIDPEHHAKKYCALYDLEIEEPNGYIFEGEYTAETRNTKNILALAGQALSSSQNIKTSNSLST